MNFTHIDDFVAKLQPKKVHRKMKMTHVELNAQGKIVEAKGTYNKVR